MKKFLALVCVCAGLTAFAAPKVSHATTNMVTKSNTLVNQLTAPAMKMAQVQNTDFQSFFRTHDIKDNMIQKQNASSRVTSAELLGTKIVMLLANDWAFTETGCDITPAAVNMMGGWETEFFEGEDGYVTVDGIYYTLPIDMVADYANETFTMPTGEIIYAYQGDRVYKNRKYIDTTEFVMMINAGWLNDEPIADVVGDILPDGSVYFEEGWAYLFMDIVNVYASETAQTPTSSDTAMSLSSVFTESYFLTPNATHAYNMSGTDREYNCYMYQYDDSTAVVWNPWGYGARGVYAFIYPDGNMIMPCYQVGCQDDVSDYAAQYTAYDWTGSENFYIMAYDTEAGDLVQDDIVGTCTSTSLMWDASVMYDLGVRKSDGATLLLLGFYPALNNVINFVDGYEFVFPQEIQDLAGEIVIGDATEEGKVSVVYTGEEEVTLEIIDQDANEYTVDADNNIQLPAYGEYTIIVTATAEGYNALEESKEVVWEAPAALRGDVDESGVVDPGDLAALIDGLLSGAALGAGADCNLDGNIDPSDLSALVDFLLSGQW